MAWGSATTGARSSGLATREYFADAAKRLQPLMGKLSTLALVVLVAATLLANLPEALAIFRTPATVSMVVVTSLAAFAILFPIAGLMRRRQAGPTSTARSS